MKWICPAAAALRIQNNLKDKWKKESDGNLKLEVMVGTNLRGAGEFNWATRELPIMSSVDKGIWLFKGLRWSECKRYCSSFEKTYIILRLDQMTHAETREMKACLPEQKLTTISHRACSYLNPIRTHKSVLYLFPSSKLLLKAPQTASEATMLVSAMKTLETIKTLQR